MMRTLYITVIASIVAATHSYSQFMSEDSKGSSTILYKGSTINLDLTETALSVNWNNLKEMAIEKPNTLLFGVSAYGKNEDGLTALLANGDFVPSTRLNGIIGVKNKTFYSAYRKEHELRIRIKEIESNEEYQRYHGQAGAIPKEVQAMEAELVNLLDAIDAIRKGSCNRNLIVFINAGTESKKFSLFNPESVADLNDHFKKKTYRSDYVDLVANYQWCGRWILGASIGYQRYNTFDSLTKKDYTVRSTVIQGDQQLITEKKYEGYSGVFKQYDRLNIKTDLLYFAKAGDDKDYRVVWNVVYTRWYLSEDKEIAKRIANIGTGINFFKREGKFVGGFYLEEGDAFNGNDVAGSDFWTRLSFGIVGKYSFQSILDHQ
jgi:hypothetical protein